MATFHRRRLPHLHQPGHPTFVTFRLADSLPNHRAFPHQRLTSGQQFVHYDRLLDRTRTGSLFLRMPSVAAVVLDVMNEIQSQSLADFDSWTIMPNHLHLILKPAVPLPQVINQLKGLSARRINQHLHREGPLWQREYFDHLIRNEDQLRKIRQYIADNPVKAGLCHSPHAWPYTHIHSDHQIK